MQITLKDYIKNPTGGKTRIVGEQEIARNVYTDKFNKVMLKVAGKIDYILFKESTKRYILYLKFPSESIDKLTYDVIIDFYTKDDVKQRMNTLNDYYVRFYSNDPNFIYTYAYIFNKNKLIVPELVNKLDQTALKEKPKTTNPKGLVGYVKSIYFAYLFFKLRGLDNKLMWLNAAPIREDAINRLVTHASKKLIQVQELNKIKNATKSGSMHIGQKDIEDVDSLKTKTKGYTNKVKTVQKSKTIARGIASRSKNVKIIKR